jgi:hypothetical protein
LLDQFSPFGSRYKIQRAFIVKVIIVNAVDDFIPNLYEIVSPLSATIGAFGVPTLEEPFTVSRDEYGGTLRQREPKQY